MEIFGALLALFGGITNGSYPTPKAKIKYWGEGQIWSAFSLLAFFIIPLAIIASNFDIFYLLSAAGVGVLSVAGILFSIGMVCFTLSLRKVGLGPAFSLNIILNTSLGTLGPLLLFHLDKALTLGSLLLYIGIILFCLGIVFLHSSLKAGDEPEKSKARTMGILLGILSGVLTSVQSSAYNFAIKNISISDIDLLVNKLSIWSIFFLSAFPLFFLFQRVRSQKTVGNAIENKFSNLFYISMMAVFYYLSIILFSWSTNFIEVPIAWPIFMTAIVLTTNFWSNKHKELVGIRSRHYHAYLITILIAFIFFALSMKLGH